MTSAQELMAQMDAIFRPETIAVVGVPRGMKSGKIFLMGLLDQGFPGRIYPVHPEANEINGLKAYSSVSVIPGTVDLTIVLVPHHEALSTVKKCANKGIKAAVLFTAGYKETGTEEGKALEEELVRVSRSAGMRLIGPNCMGLYCPKTGLSNFPQLPREPGPVGIISQSGSLTSILAHMASQRGIHFSKVVSVGNECDLTSADFLFYMGKDPETLLIGAYIEGIKDGPRFLKALKHASLNKPVILWKLGFTPEGSQAAASHTGALAGSQEIWHGMVRQAGAVPIVGLEAWVDALMGFSLLPPLLGDRMAIVSGPGGLAVSAAEACGIAGLKLAKLSSHTSSTLATFIPPAGTSLRNPIDLGFTSALNVEIFIRTVLTVAADPGVDTVVVIGRGLHPEANQLYTESMIQAHNHMQKPLIMVSIPEFERDLAKKFCEAGIPFFETAERAIITYARVRQYQLWRGERGC